MVIFDFFKIFFFFFKFQNSPFFSREPVPFMKAAPLESNILEWRYIIFGAPKTPYEGGIYQGKLLFPKDFPFKPPAILMLTPNGRFQVRIGFSEIFFVKKIRKSITNSCTTKNFVKSKILNFSSKKYKKTISKKNVGSSEKIYWVHWNFKLKKFFFEIFFLIKKIENYWKIYWIPLKLYLRIKKKIFLIDWKIKKKINYPVFKSWFFFIKMFFSPKWIFLRILSKIFFSLNLQIYNFILLFQTNTRLCLSISDYHPDTWNPAWTVSTIITGLMSFMNDNQPTLGSLVSSESERKLLARKSRQFNLKDKTFCVLFPEEVEKIKAEMEAMNQEELESIKEEDAALKRFGL